MKKKIIAIATVLTVAAMISGPGTAQALTAAELQVQIDALMAQLATLQVQLAELQGGTTGTVTGCTITSFDRALKQGMTGDDVKCLQIVLNTASDTQLASSGAGSPGNETSYFGPITKAAVIKFQEKYASEILASWGLTAGTGYVGSTTRAKLNTLLSSTVVPADCECTAWVNSTCGSGDCLVTQMQQTRTCTPGAGAAADVCDSAVTTQCAANSACAGTPGALNVTLASDTPVTGTVVDGQGLAPLAKFTFTNNGAGPVKVTQLKLNRIGVSADASLTAVYLFDGAERLTDSASVSSGVITFTETTGIFTAAAGASTTITVKSDVDGTSGETIGVSLDAATDVVSDATSVSGAFPLNSNLMTLATATLAGVNFNATTTPSTNTSLTAQDDYVVWQNTVTFTTRAVDMTRISFRMIGSIKYADIENFRLYVSGVQVGSAIESLDSDGYVTFDLTASPKRIEAGSRIIKVVADVIGGSSRDFYFSIRASADANFTDTQYNVNVLPLSDSGAFTVSDVTAGTQTVGSGTLTVTKMTDSPSGNIVNGAPAVTLAEFEFKAAGESVKIETLYVSAVVTSDGTTNAGGSTADTQVGYLRNGMLLANGVQVGSTLNLNENSYSTVQQTFSLGSSLIVEPGSPVTLAVVADVYDSDGTNNIAADYTIVARIEGGDQNNALGVTSSTTVDVPASDQDGNELTVKEGTLTFAEYTSYTDRTTVAPVNDYKLGHFTLTSDTTEAVNLSTIAVTLNSVSTNASDLWVKYGTNETSRKSSVSSTATDSFSINYTLAAGETIDVEVYTDVNSQMTGGTGQASVLITGTTADSASTIYGPSAGSALGGQTISFSTGSITSAVAGDSPLNQLVAGNQQIVGGKYKFTAISDSYTITELKVLVGATATSRVINNAILKDGDTVLGTMPFAVTTTNANDTAYFTGLSIDVPANTSKTLTVDLDLATPSSDVSSSQVDAALTMSWFQYMNSQGSIGTDGTDRAGNEIYVTRAIPVISKGSIASTAISSGQTVELYKWTVAASGPTGSEVDIRQMKFGLTWVDASSDTAGQELEAFKLYKGGVNVSSLVTILDEDGADIEDATGAITTNDTVVIRFDDSGSYTGEDVISAGSEVTYTLKATARGFDPTASVSNDNSVTIYMIDDATVNGATLKYLEDDATDDITDLVTSTGTSNLAANFIWSDNSALSHDAVTAAATGDTSGDWMNGYLVLDLPLGSEVLYGP